MANYLTLAVAGSRKTQGIIEHCASLPYAKRVLIITYTTTNQAELRSRVSKYAGDNLSIEIMGWFTFLLQHFARPFLPFKFAGTRVQGFNFDGRPHRHAKGRARFLDLNGAVYACELARLANELVTASNGALVRRLECIYDEILIDEVQDLCAHDWEIIDILLQASFTVRMVGDIRQSVLSTNPRSTKNNKYAYTEAIHWFREREARGVLEILESTTTWRCHPIIAEFSDSIFDNSWSFPKTKSENQSVTEHDGVFLVKSVHLEDYSTRFLPQCLRNNANSGKGLALECLNFRVAKGSSHERILILPTEGIVEFIRRGKYLGPSAAAAFYVAVTRAMQSVAILIDDSGISTIPYWEP